MTTSDHEEIIRLRDRVHDLEGTVRGLDMGQKAMREGMGELRDQIRDTGRELHAEMMAIQQTVNDMVSADKIAVAVTAAARRERRRFWTAGRTALAAVASLVLLTPSLHLLWGWAHGG